MEQLDYESIDQLKNLQQCSVSSLTREANRANDMNTVTGSPTYWAPALSSEPLQLL